MIIKDLLGSIAPSFHFFWSEPSLMPFWPRRVCGEVPTRANLTASFANAELLIPKRDDSDRSLAMKQSLLFSHLLFKATISEPPEWPVCSVRSPDSLTATFSLPRPRPPLRLTPGSGSISLRGWHSQSRVEISKLYRTRIVDVKKNNLPRVYTGMP